MPVPLFLFFFLFFFFAVPGPVSSVYPRCCVSTRCVTHSTWWPWWRRRSTRTSPSLYSSTWRRTWRRISLAEIDCKVNLTEGTWDWVLNIIRKFLNQIFVSKISWAKTLLAKIGCKVNINVRQELRIGSWNITRYTEIYKPNLVLYCALPTNVWKPLKSPPANTFDPIIKLLNAMKYSTSSHLTLA